jgi:hypothetical protein
VATEREREEHHAPAGNHRGEDDEYEHDGAWSHDWHEEHEELWRENALHFGTRVQFLPAVQVISARALELQRCVESVAVQGRRPFLVRSAEHSGSHLRAIRDRLSG